MEGILKCSSDSTKGFAGRFVLLMQRNIDFTLWRKWGLREPEHSAVATQGAQDRTTAEVPICPSPQPEF